VEQGIEADEPAENIDGIPTHNPTTGMLAVVLLEALVATSPVDGAAGGLTTPARPHLHGGARRDAQTSRDSATGHRDAAQTVPRMDRSALMRRRHGWCVKTRRGPLMAYQMRASATPRTASTPRCGWPPRTLRALVDDAAAR
jgi:hypothetical protein